jgi:hypothetical protein
VWPKNLYAQQLTHETVLHWSPTERSMFTLYQTQGWTYLRDLNKEIEKKKMLWSTSVTDRQALDRLQEVYSLMHQDFVMKWGTFGSAQHGVLSDEQLAKVLPQHFTPAGGLPSTFSSPSSSSLWSHVSQPSPPPVTSQRNRRVRMRPVQWPQSTQRVVMNDAEFNGWGPMIHHVWRVDSASNSEWSSSWVHTEWVNHQVSRPHGTQSQWSSRVFPFDERVLQDLWISWVNDVRARRGLPLYVHNSRLEATAQEWATVMRGKWTADHKRTPVSRYYDFKEIEQWFGSRGVVFELLWRSVFTENVGWARLECAQQWMQCTQAAIWALRSIFDYFAAEEFSATNRAHRETIIHPSFILVGVGIDYDPTTKRLYMTSHHWHNLK